MLIVEETTAANLISAATDSDSGTASRGVDAGLVAAKVGTARSQLPLLAVMPLQAIGIDSTVAQIASSALATELLRTQKVRLLERGQMNQVLLEQGFQQSGSCEESECAVQIGRLLGADQVLIGSLGRIGRSVFLNVRLVRIETGELLSGAQRSEKGELDDVLPDLVDDIARELVAVVTGMPVAPRSAEMPERGSPAAPMATASTHGVVLGLEVADFDADGDLQRAHWKLSRSIKNLCCIDAAWLHWQKSKGLLAFGPSLNAGGWVRSRFNPDAVGLELMLAGAGQVNFSRVLGRGAFLRGDVGLTQLTISRSEIGTDWGVGIASAAGWWLPIAGRTVLISAGTGWRTYMHLEYNQLWLGNLSLGILL